MVHSDWSEAEAKALIDVRKDEMGAMLPILHDLMERFGYIDDAAIPLIASALNVSKAETVGVVSFYHDFRRAPVEGPVLKICRAESCQAAGCEPNRDGGYDECRRPCPGCGDPRTADYYLHVTWARADGEVTYTDGYVCEEHLPSEADTPGAFISSDARVIEYNARPLDR